MGGRLCKQESSSCMLRPLMNLLLATELSSNERMPQVQRDMQCFGNKCYIRNALAEHEVYANDFKYLNEAIRHLLEGNHEVVKLELLRENELSKLVMKYFTYCAFLEECLNKASEIRLVATIALGQSKEEEWYLKSFEELENFKEFYQTHLIMTHREISTKLKALNKKVNKKLKSVKRWRKALTTTSVTISVVIPFIAILASPLATALVQANTILLEFICRRFDSFWKNKEKSLKRKEKVIRSMELKDVNLYYILDQIYEIGIEFESFFHNANLREEDKVKKLGEFLKKSEDLCKQAEICSSYIENAKKGVLRSLIEDPTK